jgi:hypothetical protein
MLPHAQVRTSQLVCLCKNRLIFSKGLLKEAPLHLGPRLDRIVVRTSDIGQTHRLYFVLIVLVESPERTGRSGIDLYRSAVDLRKGLNFHIVAPLTRL